MRAPWSLIPLHTKLCEACGPPCQPSLPLRPGKPAARLPSRRPHALEPGGGGVDLEHLSQCRSAPVAYLAFLQAARPLVRMMRPGSPHATRHAHQLGQRAILFEGARQGHTALILDLAVAAAAQGAHHESSMLRPRHRVARWSAPPRSPDTNSSFASTEFALTPCPSAAAPLGSIGFPIRLSCGRDPHRQLPLPPSTRAPSHTPCTPATYTSSVNAVLLLSASPSAAAPPSMIPHNCKLHDTGRYSL